MTVALVVVAVAGLIAAAIGLLTARRWKREAAQREQRVKALEPYQAVADVHAYIATSQAEMQRSLDAAEAEAQRIVAEGHRAANEVTATAQLEASRARSIADEEVSKAKKQSRELLEKARGELETASRRHQEILEEAEKQAKQIAGDALVAIQNARQAEDTVRALKNVIEGYGDAYLVPGHDLLDELGEAYSFTEAGARLKEARARIRQMVKDGKAAACDYVEDVRRETAINFVTDAFNGKVATVLAEVKEDNYGTLAQRIRDAAALVNENGKAFRNARVAPAYLELRLEELKWAAAAHELRERDREEQRLLKEKIREEERAQREFEKARKEAEKEEELLRKAMEKAQAQFDKATDAQKAKYEEQLNELAAKLQVAEEKGKRAMSMAQQTKAGHVYVISNQGSFGENVFKIGLTRRLEPMDRIKELGDASVPFDFDVHALIPSEDAPALEHALHKLFVRRQMNKVNPRKEFFRVSVEEVRSAIEKAGCHAAWTMTAECRQYRETLALERAMRDANFPEEAWIDKQIEEHDRAMLLDAEKEERALASV